MQTNRTRFFMPGNNRYTKLCMYALSLLIGGAIASANIFGAGPTTDTIVLYLFTALAPHIVYILCTLRSRVLFTIIVPPVCTVIVQLMLQAQYYSSIASGNGLAYAEYLYTIVLTVPQAALATALSAAVAAFVRRRNK